MIARTWHGAVPTEKADAYHDLLLRTGVADYRATQGNRGVFVLRRFENGLAHFLVLTLWDTVESVRAFAGPDVERARYYPDDERFLVELEPSVTHYDVLVPEDISASSGPR